MVLGYARTVNPHQPPPLFVVALSEKGARHEGLIEPDVRAPSWLRGNLSVRVSAPNGETAETMLEAISPETSYERCLQLIRPNFGWKPTQDEPQDASPLKVEVWSHEHVDVTSYDTWLHITADGFPSRPAATDDTTLLPQCVAVVRHRDGTVFYSKASHLFYLELYRGESDDPFIVPKGIIDTGLPGAFWGFVEQRNRLASEHAAERLLVSLFEEKSGVAHNEVDLAAASHALLNCRDLLPRFGKHVLTEIDGLKGQVSDLVLMKALLQLAMSSSRELTRETIIQDVRHSFSVLAEAPPIFGETLRWLDAKYSVLVELLKEHGDSALSHDVEKVGDILSASFVGGQLAVYEGDPPETYEFKQLAQKKTLPI